MPQVYTGLPTANWKQCKVWAKTGKLFSNSVKSRAIKGDVNKQFKTIRVLAKKENLHSNCRPSVQTMNSTLVSKSPDPN